MHVLKRQQTVLFVFRVAYDEEKLNEERLQAADHHFRTIILSRDHLYLCSQSGICNFFVYKS